MFIEIGKTYINRYYNGNTAAAVAARDGVIWSAKKIKKAFNFGNGTQKDFNEYKKSNSVYAYFIKI